MVLVCDMFTADVCDNEILNRRVFDQSDPNDILMRFQCSFKDLIDKHAPVKRGISKPQQPPYMNSKWRKAIMNKARLKHRRDRFPTKANHEWFRVQRNLTESIKKQSKKNYIDTHCNTSEPKNNFWKIVRPVLSNKGSAATNDIQLMEDGKIVSNQKEVGDIFNHFYVNVANDIGAPQPDTSHLTDAEFVTYSVNKYEFHDSVVNIRSNATNMSFSFTPVTVGEMTKILQKMDENKATGSDEIPAKFLKLAGNELSDSLCHLVNQCFEKAEFPDACKEANFTPIYKKGDHLLKSNYRPVSVLTATSKVIESCMNSQIQSFFANLYSPYLAAFRTGYSTQHVLYKLVEEWKDAIDKGFAVGSVLMDLSKAFDCLPHDLLIAKLHAYGLDGNALKLCSSYLRRRKQRMKLSDMCSEWLNITKGVPQGSILGPVLFNVFINDLFYSITRAKLFNYADDNTLNAVGTTVDQVRDILTVDTELSIKWFEQNIMKANPDKFQFIVSQKRGLDQQDPLTVLNIEIPISPYVNLLGVLVDNKLDFSEHIDVVVRKSSRQVTALYRFGKHLSEDRKLCLVKSFLMSNFNYCSLSWHFCGKQNSQKLERILKRALRFVFNDCTSSYDNL